MIGKSIQTRLFSAVFLVIFMMTFGVGITFFLSSRWYVHCQERNRASDQDGSVGVGSFEH